MWNSLKLCWWTLYWIQLTAGAFHGNAPIEESQPAPRRNLKEASLMSSIGKGSFTMFEPEHFGTVTDEELMLDRTALYDEEQDIAEAMSLQSRAVRSPRRCFRHQESCLGHQLPCCDPCDTCYCRFFNAICYCRRISQACLHGRH